MEGWSELDKALGELPKATAANTLRRVLRKAAEPIKDDMRSRAPVDDPANTPKRPPGRLKNSIIVGTRLNRRQAASERKDGKSFASVYIGTNDRVGVLQEFGTYQHPAHPFGVPAWEANRDMALVTIGEQLGTEIEKSATRYAKKLAKG